MRKLIAALEVAGGLLTFATVSAAWARYGFAPNLFALVAVSFSSLCVLAGTELWRAHRRGLWFSVLAQLPQILMIGTPRFAFKVQGGLQALITLRPTTTTLWLGLTTDVTLAPDKADPVFVAVNLVPIIVLALLWRVRVEVRPGPSAQSVAPEARAA